MRGCDQKLKKLKLKSDNGVVKSILNETKNY